MNSPILAGFNLQCPTCNFLSHLQLPDLTCTDATWLCGLVTLCETLRLWNYGLGIVELWKYITTRIMRKQGAKVVEIWEWDQLGLGGQISL